MDAKRRGGLAAQAKLTPEEKKERGLNLARNESLEAKRRGGLHVPTEAARAGGRNGSRAGKRIGGQRSALMNNHERWHIRRGIFQPACVLCCKHLEEERVMEGRLL
jgi:hypothetical protein